jgi:hypothetical protein
MTRLWPAITLTFALVACGSQTSSGLPGNGSPAGGDLVEQPAPASAFDVPATRVMHPVAPYRDFGPHDAAG